MAGSEDDQTRAAVAPFPPVAAQFVGRDGEILGHERLMTLELEDGAAYQGYSFGAEKSISGELVFQTGIRPAVFSFSFFQIEVSIVMESNLGDLRHGGIPGVYNGPFVSGTDIGYNIPPSRKLRYAMRSSCK